MLLTGCGTASGGTIEFDKPVYVGAGGTDLPIQCYRRKGDGAASLAVDDSIAVSGIIQNHKGTIEFSAGSTYVPEG